jgi:hypothetical protein
MAQRTISAANRVLLLILLLLLLLLLVTARLRHQTLPSPATLQSRV